MRMVFRNAVVGSVTAGGAIGSVWVLLRLGLGA